MASRSLKYFDLGAQGADYVRAHLLGANPFCSSLLEVVAQHPGSISTLAPADTAIDRLVRFREGGLLPENLDVSQAIQLGDGQGSLMSVASLRDEQVALLRSIMHATPGSVCIVDDFNPRWEDIRDEAYYPAAFGASDQVFHLLTADSDVDMLVDAIQAGNTVWHGVAAVCATPPVLGEGRQSTETELQKSAHSVLALTCTAYDGEGFVLWRR
jgi:hypothetical protein